VTRLSKEFGYSSVSHSIHEVRGRFGVTPRAYCDAHAPARAGPARGPATGGGRAESGRVIRFRAARGATAPMTPGSARGPGIPVHSHGTIPASRSREAGRRRSLQTDSLRIPPWSITSLAARRGIYNFNAPRCAIDLPLPHAHAAGRSPPGRSEPLRCSPPGRGDLFAQSRCQASEVSATAATSGHRRVSSGHCGLWFTTKPT